MNKKFSDPTLCNAATGACIWSQPCDAIKKRGFDFAVGFFDESGAPIFKIPAEKLLVPAIHFDGDKNSCYLSIFNHGMKGFDEQNLMILG